MGGSGVGDIGWRVVAARDDVGGSIGDTFDGARVHKWYARNGGGIRATAGV